MVTACMSTDEFASSLRSLLNERDKLKVAASRDHLADLPVCGLAVRTLVERDEVGALQVRAVVRKADGREIWGSCIVTDLMSKETVQHAMRGMIAGMTRVLLEGLVLEPLVESIPRRGAA